MQAGPVQTTSLRRLRPAKINFYLKYMQLQGFGSEQVLAGTGLQARQLADPHCLVEISPYIRIIANINRLSRSPSLAFSLGEHLTLGDLGILGYSAMSCSDTDQAIRLWHRYNPVFFGNLIEMAFEQVGNKLLLSYLPYADIRADLLQFLIEEKIAYDMALQRLVGIDKFPVEHLMLTYPQPAHLSCYTRLMDCPIEFSAARSTMRLWDHATAIPLRGHDAETHEHCFRLLDDVFNSVNAGSTISHKVRAILHDHLRTPLGIDAVAERLHCTARTLNRRLEKEALNFTDISIATRLEAIRNLLATTTLEGKEIAVRVGFSDVRSLRRFFRTHTDKTLQQFRVETTGGAG